MGSQHSSLAVLSAQQDKNLAEYVGRCGLKSQKVMIVGLDGATFDLIRPWVAQGELPTFERLMREGAWGEMEAELPPATLPNWPSFATGKNAGKHGMIFWLRHRRDTNDLTVVNSEAMQSKTLWELLGEVGKRVAVVNVPGTYPPKPVNGVMITGMLTPPSAEVYTYPKALREELETEVGGYQIFPEEVYATGREERFLASLKETAERRFEAVKYLLGREAWDLFIVVFNCTDLVQHTFWHCLCPEHPQHDPPSAEGYGKAILGIYRQMDGILNYLVDQADEMTTLVVMSDHGAGPVHKEGHINNWLLQEGLLCLKPSTLSQIKYVMFRSGFTPQNIYRLGQRLGLIGHRRRVDPQRQPKGLLRRVFLSHQDVDWANTKAFALGGSGRVYINLQGKWPEGPVAPGSEYEDLRDQVIAGLRRLTLPGSDRPYVARAHKKEDLYHGEALDAMPDIVFEPADYNYHDYGDFEFFSNRLFDDPMGVSGRHRRNGILLFFGSQIRGGKQPSGARIFDIAPTILHLMGQPVPTDMDGRVLGEALSEDFMRQNPVRSGKPSGHQDSRETSWSAEDEEAVKERLRGLGYIG